MAATGERVYAGHWIETAFLPEKERLLKRFYDPATTDTWRNHFLKDMGAVYLWYDEYARTLGDWDPAAATYLQPVFVTDSLSIYRVRLPS